jgi:hypothetical protein
MKEAQSEPLCAGRLHSPALKEPQSEPLCAGRLHSPALKESQSEPLCAGRLHSPALNSCCKKFQRFFSDLPNALALFPQKDRRDVRLPPRCR